MALWLVRAGKYGEHEARFLDEGRIFLSWGNLTQTDLAIAPDYEAIKNILIAAYPSEPAARVRNWAGQVWAFALAIKAGDWVVLPSKQSPTIAIGEVTGGYEFHPGAEPDYRHQRTVRWLVRDMPRAAFDQDLLYSFGAFLTVCEIKRNDAEKRVRALVRKSSGSVTATATPSDAVPSAAPSDSGDDAEVDLEQLARDGIAKLINQRFKGHAMARLVDAVLRAQGLTTFLSPEGPDKGIDILASGGAFGFDRPKICVQVKSADSPADRPEFTQLIGAMQNVGADHGLFVSWGGFKSTVVREVPDRFFKVRLWNGNDLIEQVLANYDQLDSEIKADLPLKRVWTVANPEV